MKKTFTIALFAIGLLLSGCDKLKEDLESLRNSEGVDVVPESLLAYYNFNDKTGNDVTDNEYHGSFTNSPSLISETPSGKGYALHLQSSKDQRFVIPYSILGNNDFTVAFWVKDFGETTFFSENGDYNLYFFASTNNFGIGKKNYYGLGNFDYQPKSLMSSGWHHLVIMYSKEERNCYLYVDGVRVDLIDWTYGSGGGKLIFGAAVQGLSQSSFKIDNIRIYNRILDSDEVSTIYNHEK
ncbi:MAG: LamG domain-containing protein [Bacteroidales bacterium]|nr:LamG domain-containing protein [Bacteroidales bacterium]